MKIISLPLNVCQIGDIKWSAVHILRNIVFILPYWKNEMDINRVGHLLDIEDAIDSLDLELKLKISDDSHGSLKAAMQMMGVNPLQEPQINRLYMRVYKAVLAAQSESS